MSTESVFISYANKDAQFAKDFAKTLIKAGANVWIESIHGQDDDDVTGEAIQNSKIFLIITSEHALNDASVKQEKKEARRLGIQRILVKITPCNTSKFRWNDLPLIDLTDNKEQGMKAILEKLNLEGASVPHVETPVANETKPIEVSETPKEVEPQETEAVSEPVTVEPSTSTTESTSSDLARKQSLLVSEDEIETVRNMFKRQVRNSKMAIYTFAGVSVVIIVVAYVFFGNYFSSDEIKEVAEGFEGTYDKLTKFIPAVGAILPNAFSGISASKINDKKKRIAIVDKLERTRDRYIDNLAGTSEAEIKALEEKLEELITI
ncbi:MAG: toll/interleukin-1 receptor domain-containing protein [Bacteroidia bacterium]|nr:toll/interleukin-1 receptor domain-containing protein [Bacteroidia bacterium]MBT8279017.1 toll/interleukin-1 receptor domain-containing protein [Bacteroidia bacterium]NND24657.1 toll/interleukin-1 receptor domain-containing protein [Flavobacteriaceae bacterium]NNK60343.1 toll/interleukin-1 receptor domain-containing protein [Flavobacteriaceae bacterium]RZW56308.1 MAG: toll/interleukin-1 receptor domain-containing protein [Flavobacteriaceae bacterium]